MSGGSLPEKRSGSLERKIFFIRYPHGRLALPGLWISLTSPGESATAYVRNADMLASRELPAQ